MKHYFFSNWKMYLTHKQQCDLAEQIAKLTPSDNISCVVFPNTLSFLSVQEILKKSSIDCGLQHGIATPQGAYTGETSVHLAAEVGARYALVGHSEQRHVFGENNEHINKQLLACFEEQITPVLCVGETTQDIAEKKAEYRIKKQLMKALHNIPKDAQFFVAYEPVWAISHSGEGEACSREQAEHMHKLIVQELKQYSSQKIPVLYGGSVNEKNVVSFLSQDSIDGVLVGSASTQFDRYTELYQHIHRISA